MQDWEVWLLFFIFWLSSRFAILKGQDYYFMARAVGTSGKGEFSVVGCPVGKSQICWWWGHRVHADLFDAKLGSQILSSLCAQVIGPTRTESEEPKEVEPMEAAVIVYAAPCCIPTKMYTMSICECAAPRIIPCRFSWQFTLSPLLVQTMQD